MKKKIYIERRGDHSSYFTSNSVGNIGEGTFQVRIADDPKNPMLNYELLEA